MTQPASPSLDDYVVVPENSQLRLAIRLRQTNDSELEADLVHISDASDDALSVLSLDTDDQVKSPPVIAGAPEQAKTAESPKSSPHVIELPYSSTACTRTAARDRAIPLIEPAGDIAGDNFQGPYGTSRSSTACMTGRRTTDPSSVTQTNVPLKLLLLPTLISATSDLPDTLHKRFDSLVLRHLIQHALLHAPHNSTTASLFRDERLQAQMLRRLERLPEDNVVRRVVDTAHISPVSAHEITENNTVDVSRVLASEVSILTDVEILAMHFLMTHHSKQFGSVCSLPRISQLGLILPKEEVPLKAQTLALEIEEKLLQDDSVCIGLDLEARTVKQFANGTHVQAAPPTTSSGSPEFQEQPVEQTISATQSDKDRISCVHGVRQDALNDIKSIAQDYQASLALIQRHEARMTSNLTQNTPLSLRHDSSRNLSSNPCSGSSSQPPEASLLSSENKASLADYQQQMKLLEQQINTLSRERQLAKLVSAQRPSLPDMQRREQPAEISKEDYAAQLKILEAANRRRLAMAAAERTPVKVHALQDYEMQLKVLEQQNKKRKAMQMQLMNSQSAKRLSRTSPAMPTNFLDLEDNYLRFRIHHTADDYDQSVCGFYRKLREYWQDALKGLSEEQRKLPVVALPTVENPRPDSQLNHIEDVVIQNFKDVYTDCVKTLKMAESQLSMGMKGFPDRPLSSLRKWVDDQQAITTTAHRHWLNSKFEHRYRHERALSCRHVRGPCSSESKLEGLRWSIFGPADEQYCWVCTKHRLDDPEHRLLRDASKRPAGRAEHRATASSLQEDEVTEPDTSTAPTLSESDSEISRGDMNAYFVKYRPMPDQPFLCQCKRCSIILASDNLDALKNHIEICGYHPIDPFPKKFGGDTDAQLRATSAAVEAYPSPIEGDVMDIDVRPQMPWLRNPPKAEPTRPEPKNYQDALRMLEEQCRRRMHQAREEGTHV